MIQVYEWRGGYFDANTRDALIEAARIVGNDIYLKPIKGCGSYQGHTVICDGKTFTLGSTAASAATHTGAGAVDIDCEGLTDEQARRVETALRKVGFAAWFRPRVSPYTGNSYGWQRHCHALLMGAALSDSADRQVGAYLNGWDGLAVPHKDPGTRAYVTVRWATYSKPAVSPPKARTYTIPSGGTLATAAAVLGASVAAVAAFNGITNPDVVHPGQVVTAPPSGYVVPTSKPPVKVAPLTAAQLKAAAAKRAAALKAAQDAQAKRAAHAAVVKRAEAIARAKSTVKRADLKPRRTNVSVKRLEIMLNRKGVLAKRYVDGYYGTATQSGVYTLYRKMNWSPKGTVPGPVMLRYLALHTN
jgi:hypothetical protein